MAKELKEKIAHLVSQHGVNSVPDMRAHLEVFIKDDLFREKPVPPKTDNRYWPSDEDIRNHLYMAQIRNRHSKIDQQNVMLKLREWEQDFPDDSFYFRPSALHVSNNEEDAAIADDLHSNLFFCHQTKHQRHLLSQYGRDICLLDATYKTTRYALPLFFVAVKTNMSYAIVGSFVTHMETKESIAEGLRTLRDWSGGWCPRFFMTDLCEAEIQAVEEVFPGTYKLLILMVFLYL